MPDVRFQNSPCYVSLTIHNEMGVLMPNTFAAISVRTGNAIVAFPATVLFPQFLLELGILFIDLVCLVLAECGVPGCQFRIRNGADLNREIGRVL